MGDSVATPRVQVGGLVVSFLSNEPSLREREHVAENLIKGLGLTASEHHAAEDSIV